MYKSKPTVRDGELEFKNVLKKKCGCLVKGNSDSRNLFYLFFGRKKLNLFFKN